MHVRYKNRISLILFSLLAIGIAAGLMLYALRKNIDLYYTPSQLLESQVSASQSVKLGGLVKTGSFQREAADRLKSTFFLMDQTQEVKVIYRGVLPALFREGQGIVVQGHFGEDRIFVADEVFAKHDEKYEPPGVRKK